MQRTLSRIAAVAATLMLLTTAAASAAGAPLPGSLRLAPVRAADPYGGPDYTFATYRAPFTFAARTPIAHTIMGWCTTRLRLDGNRLGTVDPATGAFTPTTLAAAVADAANLGGCSGGLPMTWINSAPGTHPVTFDGGWFGAGLTSIAIEDHGRWRPLPLTADGTFLVALPGGYADAPNPAHVPLIPLVRVTATLCGPHARRDLLAVGDTTRTGRCELTSYLPGRNTPSGRASRHRLHRRARRR